MTSVDHCKMIVGSCIEELSKIKSLSARSEKRSRNNLRQFTSLKRRVDCNIQHNTGEEFRLEDDCDIVDLLAHYEVDLPKRKF